MSSVRYAVRVKRKLPGGAHRWIYVREVRWSADVRRHSAIYFSINADDAMPMQHSRAMAIAAELAKGKTRENRDAYVVSLPIVGDT